ncbi:MAG TPA: acyltransferase [Kiritimatiellia bacterium]|jgi:acetyltransferase-like isoleucine patch superfamily enzyme|nr:acyltransferase [Kiritimatiellia bacterium]HQF19717.1 acyltransferase [Kiritimatiellia bacterium]HQG73677.1 acyltransferase [Kiritimatiellia bacterium]
MAINIHPTADVQSHQIGEGTRIWQFCVVLGKARIGRNCNVNCHVFIENDVVIGDNVTLKPGVQVWDGVRLGDRVFVGPNATFTNDLTPRSQRYPTHFVRTVVEEGASIGANATIVAGVVIGAYALVGAGSVVTKNIPPYTVWIGNPARPHGFITKDGVLLSKDLKDKAGRQYRIVAGEPQLP